jgi:hypothetical protein
MNENLKNQLLKRARRNLAEYKKTILGFDAETIYEMADKISATENAYLYLRKYLAEEIYIRFLLQFQNPLEVVADSFLRYAQDFSDMSFAVRGLCNGRADLKEYALAEEDRDKDERERGGR